MLDNPQPIDIQLLQKSRQVKIKFDTGEVFVYSCYQLRKNTPSADKYQTNGVPIAEISPEVNIVAIEPVGHYAVKFIFDDGHNTGIYQWSLLYNLASFKSEEHF